MPQSSYCGQPVTYITRDGVKVTAYPSMNNPRLYRVVAYCRVSTLHVEQQNSLKAQIEYYQEFIRLHRAWIMVDVYSDTKSARSIHARDGFEKMIEDGLAGKFDIIVTKTVSRFGRNTVDTLTVLRKLKAAGIDVFFENENLHSNDGNDELLISLIEAVAQAESLSRSDNIKWGIKQSAQSPDAPIYSRPCYGYRRSDDRQLVIDEEEAAIVKMIFRLYLHGSSVLSVKRELEAQNIPTPTGKSQWSKRTIETILANEKYAGDVVVYKTYCPEYPKTGRVRNVGQKDQFSILNHHQPIISKTAFEKAQEERKRRSNVTTDEDGIKHRKSSRYSMKCTAEKQLIDD